MNFDSIERLNLGIAGAAVAAAFAIGSPNFAASVALGAGIEALNYHVLRSAAARLFAGELAVGSAWVAGFGLRFAVLGVAIALSLRAGADPVGLVLGLSVILPAVLIGAWRSRPPVQATAPAISGDDPSWERWNPWLAREQEAEDEEDQ